MQTSPQDRLDPELLPSHHAPCQTYISQARQYLNSKSWSSPAIRLLTTMVPEYHGGLSRMSCQAYPTLPALLAFVSNEHLPQRRTASGAAPHPPQGRQKAKQMLSGNHGLGVDGPLGRD